jgi:cell division protein FtsL
MDKAQLRRWLNIACIVLIVVLVIGLYKTKSDASRAEARVAAMEREVAAREADVRALRAEAATLERPERIERLAAEKLGVHPASASVARPEASLGESLPAPAATGAPE